MAKYASLDILEDAAVLDSQHKRQVNLTWNIVRFKLMYYYPELIDENFIKTLKISDEQYDKYKKEYLVLCQKLNVENIVVKTDYDKETYKEVKGDGMSEIDFDRQIVKASLNYVGIEEWKAKVRDIEAQARIEKAEAEAKKEEDLKKAEELADEIEKNWIH